MIKILVGNKKDVSSRQVSEEEAKELAANLNIPYFEVSAKTGDNI